MSSTPLSSPSRQSRISNFFSQSPKQHKRAVSPGGILNEPPKKKKRTGQHTTGTVVGPSREQWGFTPCSTNDVHRTVPTEVLARREEFKKKLLLDNNPLLRRAHQRETAEAQDTEPIVVSDSDSDHAFQEMTALFASKTGEGNKKSAQRAKKSKALELGPSGKTYTPLEKQYMNLKQANPDVLLMVQVGYKYKFFGDDAKVAAKELGMACFQDRNFLAASIPEHRRDIHLKKLLCQGYKVGIVQQVETAALKKAGDNKNTVFDRKLVKLFTAATYVDGLDSLDDTDKYTSPRVVCVIEEKSEKTAGAHVCIGMVSVSPGTGEVVWDAFDDNPMRIELETRLVHLKPTELLIQPSGLSKFTEKMISHFSGYFIIVSTESKIRTEHLNETMSFSDAFDFVVTFYSAGKADSDLKDDQRLAALPGFPKFVVVALAHVISYLSDFDIAGPLSTAVFNKFTSSSHMLLAGNTLANLEIFRNETDLSTKGSLIWILDKTNTAFGARMLKTWISKPLIDKCALQERIDAVEEILNSPSDKLHSLRDLLKRLPDLEKGLVRIQYKQANPQELTVLLSAFYKIGSAFTADTVSNPSFKSRLLNEIIASLPPLNQPMKMLKDAIHSKQAAEGRKDIMWTDPTKFPVIEDNILAIRAVEMELDEELKKIRKTLKYPSLKWTTVGGEEYLIEVKKSDKRPIPDSYHPAISKTKYAERYRSPEVKQKLQERARWNESLQIEAHGAFLSFLDEVGLHYAIMRNAVNKLAVADCLMSFAQVALRENYVKPEFTEEPILEIVDGRHPMVEALRSDPFVANSVYMGGEEATSKIITGPNMGGKSSCVRMVALLVIMAQIGSYVPATSVKLGMHDKILTRMGANDDIVRGRSTFMVEMTECAEILHSASDRSLVILDELGRGTSTFDGMAIAFAALHQLVVTTQCKTLFITHYPLVALEMERKFPERVQNIHVGYHVESGIRRRDVTFLYRLTSGIASESFGVECARLAGLPEPILDNAKERASQLEIVVAARAKRNALFKALRLLKQCLQVPDTEHSTISAAAAVEELVSTTAILRRAM